MLQSEDDYVVCLDSVGNRRDDAVRRFNFLRQIVYHPVRNVLDAVGTEQIEGLVGFGEARAFPGAWLASGEGGDGIDGSTNRVGLVIKLMRRALNEAVTHELKAGIARRRGHPGYELKTLPLIASVVGMLRSVRALNCHQKPARMPYSCQLQFGTSGSGGCPIGGDSTVRGMAFSMRHSSTFRMIHTASFFPPGSRSLGRSMSA